MLSLTIFVAFQELQVLSFALVLAFQKLQMLLFAVFVTFQEPQPKTSGPTDQGTKRTMGPEDHGPEGRGLRD